MNTLHFFSGLERSLASRAWKRGPIGARSGYIMTRVSKDEFFAGVKAETTAKGFDYTFLPKDERKVFDQLCAELGGDSCEKLLK